MIYAVTTGSVLLVWLAIVLLNERFHLLSCDRFPSPLMKWLAYAWLGVFMAGMALMVTASAQHQPTAKQIAQMSFIEVFTMHGILILFLLGWWALSGTPPWKEFLQIRHERPAEVAAIGLSVGVGGWIITIATAAMVALLLQATGVLKEPPAPPAMIPWMAALAWWKKLLIVLSAMTVEEFFFRSFLQKRIGLVASTILFGLAHFTYGNPMMLIGVTVVSIVISIAFWRTKNVVPGIIAHGVFDAIQLFVIVPVAVRMMGVG
jgi:membrane protease YdiL (CAAX protease family)